MEAAVSPIPNDVDGLKALLATTTRRVNEAEAALANARARESAAEAMIAHLKLQNAMLRREQYGPSAERTERLLAQMELALEDLEADAAADELAAEAAAAKTTSVVAFERKKPVRKPFPEHAEGILVGHLWNANLITFGMDGQSRRRTGHYIAKGGISVEPFDLAQR